MSVEEALRILNGAPAAEPKSEGMDNGVQSALDILSGNKKPGYTYGQRALQAVHGAASTLGGLADLIGTPDIYREAAAMQDYEMPAIEAHKHLTQGVNKLAGRNLEPNDIAGKILHGAGSFAIPGKPATMATGLLSGAASGLAQGLGANPIAADIAAGIGVPGAISKIRNIAGRAAPALSGAERKAGQYLGGLSEEGPEVIAKRLRDYVPAVPGYEPATADIAKVPGLAQIYRAQQGVAGTGLAEHHARGSEKLIEALEGVKPAEFTNEPGRFIQKELKGKLEEAKKIRHEAANPHYEKLSKLEGMEVSPNLEDYLDTLVVKGDMKKDMDYVRKMLMEGEPGKKGKTYIQGASSKSSGIAQPVQDLDAVRQGINAKIDDYSAHMTRKSAKRVGNLIGARDALDKDLAHIPEQIAATAQYKKFSAAVNKIEEHDILGRVVKEKKGKFEMPESQVVKKFINNSPEAAESTRALREVVGEEGKLTDELRRLRIQQLQDRVIDEGNLSPHKMKIFIKQNKKSIDTLLDENQKAVVYGIDKALAGRRYTEKAGAAFGSPTQAHARNALDLTHGMKRHLSRAALKAAGIVNPIPNKLLDATLDLLSHLRKRKSEAILNRALVDREYAAMLMTNPLKDKKSAEAFIKYFNAAPIASHRKESEE